MYFIMFGRIWTFLQATPAILDYPRLSKIILMWQDFWFSRLFVWAGRKNNPKWTTFVICNTYLHQTFTECGSNQYTYFHVSICQMWLQVTERLLVLLHFLGTFKNYLRPFVSEVLYLHQTFICMCLIYIHILVCQYAKCDCNNGRFTVFHGSSILPSCGQISDTPVPQI